MIESPVLVFDRRVLRRRRNRVADPMGGSAYLLADVGERLADRLDDIRRTFPRVLDLGCHRDLLSSLVRRRNDVDLLVQSDVAENMLLPDSEPGVVADEEILPFAPACFDLVISLLSLQWVNDVPGTLAQVRAALKPDGLFLAAVPGGQTLQELRHCLAEAEMAIDGGVSPRVSPFIDVRDAGGLLQRAGFTLPVVDTDILTVWYPDVFALFADLRALGATNAVIERRRGFTGRRVLADAVERYQQAFSDSDGRVKVTFQVVYLTGWAPAATQPKPLRRGSGRVSLEDALAQAGHGPSEPRGWQ
jgi:NADH dehydrogenase [ubiquinone] 1 alpha subcomplex assembly factor 5